MTRNEEKQILCWHVDDHNVPRAPHIEVPAGRDLVVVCVGTDWSTGDSLGPLVGGMLKRAGVANVHGTLDDPVHAENLAQTLLSIGAAYSDPYVIAVDATLGRSASIGKIRLIDAPLQPGTGAGKNLPEVGDIHISGIVNVGGFMEYFVLQNTRLSLVMRMAEQAAAFAAELVERATWAQAVGEAVPA